MILWNVMRAFHNCRMARPLLSIALTVDQHEEGDFYWVLIESFDHSMEFEPLMESGKGFATYIDALEAGFLALKALSEDLVTGPRDEVDEDDSGDGPDGQ
ncbi:hypothetical protein APY03_6493 [Variovorax sp. WDL1]|nr:hypothetical protein APY03_6493 [Variovorax sp. WDL1]